MAEQDAAPLHMLGQARPHTDKSTYDGTDDEEELPQSMHSIAGRVSPLPQRAHERLANASSPSPKRSSKDRIDARLQSASDRRAAFQQWVAGKGRKHAAAVPTTGRSKKSPQQRNRRGLEDKLEAAQRARRNNLDEQVEKARYLGHRAVQRAAKKLERERNRQAERLQTALDNAEQRRQLQLERQSERLAHRNQRVREASQAAKQRRADRSRKQGAAMEERLRRAARRRQAQKLRPGSSALKEHKASALQERLSSKVLQRMWRSFKASGKTTHELATAFSQTGICIDSARKDGFDSFARKLQSRKTLTAARSLLQRIANKLQQLGESTATDEYLLKHVRSNSDAADEQFPVRVVLCAFMIVGQPEAVFNAQGDKEEQLTGAAYPFALSLEQLIEHMQRHGAQGAGEKLREFCKCWELYLERFVAWKVHDAADLEGDLIRTAGDLKASALSKIPDAPRDELTHDQAAVIDQVQSDLKLLRNRVRRLTGEAGVQRLEGHIAAVTRAAEERKLQTETGETDTESDADLSGAFSEEDDVTTPAAAASTQRHQRSPQQRQHSPIRQQQGSQQYQQQPQQQQQQQQGMRQASLPGQRPLEQEDPSVADERFVHELLHDPDFKLPEVEDPMAHVSEEPPSHDVSQEEKLASMQRRMKAQINRAFWDSVEEVIKGNDANARNSRAMSLLEELRSELTDVVPPQRRSLVDEQLDAEELRRALNLLDSQPRNALVQLRSLLTGAARLLKDLGAPARDEEVQRGVDEATSATSNSNLSASSDGNDSREAAAKAITQAFRFLLHQAKVLKRDTANAQVSYLRSILRNDNAGIEWARKRFARRHNLELNSEGELASSELDRQLPRTFATLSSTMRHVHSLQLDLLPYINSDAVQSAASVSYVPSTMATGMNAHGVGSCGERSDREAIPVSSLKSVEALVRLAVVELVQEPKRLDPGRVPETLVFDTERLVAGQNHFQQLIVQAACLLVCRQLGGGDDVRSSLAARVKSLVASSNARLNDLALEVASLAGKDEQAGMAESLLRRLTNPEDAMFKRVTSTLASALRALVLLGRYGHQPAKEALSRSAAVELFDEAVQLAQSLLKIANVAIAVHRPVFSNMLNSALAEMSTPDASAGESSSAE